MTYLDCSGGHTKSYQCTESYDCTMMNFVAKRIGLVTVCEGVGTHNVVYRTIVYITHLTIHEL